MTPGPRSGSEPTEPGDSAPLVRRVEITAKLDRQAVEALRLEIRRLGQRYGIDVGQPRVERVEAEGEEAP